MRNVNVNNLVQIIVQHPAFQETINSILTTNQEQSTNIVPITSAKIQKCKGRISLSSFYGQLLT